MTTRIEPPMTRIRSGGTAPHVRTLGPVPASPTPVAATSPSSEYVKYPRAAKAVFALAAATIVFAIVQSAAILVVTAWLFLVGFILQHGCKTGKPMFDNIVVAYPGGADSRSISRYGDPFYHN